MRCAAVSNGSGSGLHTGRLSPESTQAARWYRANCLSKGSVSQPGLLVMTPHGMPCASSCASTDSKPGNSRVSTTRCSRYNSRNRPCSAARRTPSAPGKAARSKAAEPCETYWRRSEYGNGASCCAARSRLTMRAMSGPVSSNVPSRSSNTAASGVAGFKRRSTGQMKMRHIVDAGIGADAGRARERIEFDAADIAQLQSVRAGQPRQLGGTYQARVLVRAARDQIEQVLRADDREQKRAQIAVDGGDHQFAARTQQRADRGQQQRRTRHVLDELHAGDQIERTGAACSQLFGGTPAIVDLQLILVCVQLRDLYHGRRQVDAAHLRAMARQRFGQQAAAAADVQHTPLR